MELFKKIFTEEENAVIGLCGVRRRVRAEQMPFTQEAPALQQPQPALSQVIPAAQDVYTNLQIYPHTAPQIVQPQMSIAMPQRTPAAVPNPVPQTIPVLKPIPEHAAGRPYAQPQALPRAAQLLQQIKG